MISAIQICFGQSHIGELCNGGFEERWDDELNMCTRDSNTIVGDAQCYLLYSEKWEVEIEKNYSYLWMILVIDFLKMPLIILKSICFSCNNNDKCQP
jgi:hypothetical protein